MLITTIENLKVTNIFIKYKYIGFNSIKMRILFINHKKSQCGVYNYGKRLFDIWKKSLAIDFDYIEIDSLEEYNNIEFSDYNYIVYNYHSFLACLEKKWFVMYEILKIFLPI